jgi:TPR repeat protein
LTNAGSQTALYRLDDDAIARLLDRSKTFLNSGDLASARLLLERAAEAGNANAALMLGETFDPHFLQVLGAVGMNPDAARARQWYEKAAALGSNSASQRLEALNGR